MNLLLIRTGGVGDCILTLPVASRLRELYPDDRLHVLGNRTMRDVARLAGGYAGFNSIDKAGFVPLFSGADPTDFLRSYFSRFDGVWIFTAADTETVQRKVTASGALSCHALDPRLPEGFGGHIAAHLLSILDESPPEHPSLPQITFDDPPIRVPYRLLIHPGSGSISKIWPIDRFLSVAERWAGDAAFLLGPAEEERNIAKLIPERWETLRCFSIGETARELASAGLFLGCDSGVSHLAALCRTPSVVLFGPTDPSVWRPLGERTIVLSSADGFMEGIGVEDVLAALEREHAKKGTASRTGSR